jgi:UV DNA damage repair endonuclease
MVDQIFAGKSSNSMMDEIHDSFVMPIDNDESMDQLSIMLKEKRARIQLVCKY